MTRELTAGRRALLAVGGVFLVLLVAWSVTNLIAWSGRATVVTNTTTPAPSSKFSLRTGSGDVDLLASTDGRVHIETRVRYGLRNPNVSLVTTARGLEAKSQCWWLDQVCQVSYIIALPPELDAFVQTGSGDVRLTALAGNVTVTTGSGDVTVRDATGGLVLRTGSGDVDASGLTADAVETRTGSGDVTLRFDDAPVSLNGQTGSGDINVIVSPGQAYSVQVKTGSGDQHIAVPRNDSETHRITMRTGSGDVTVKPRG